MHKIFRLFQKAYHLALRLIKEIRHFPSQYREFGWEVAKETFIDGLIPPGKREKYINTISSYVDTYLSDIIEKYEDYSLAETDLYGQKRTGKLPIWCCWWQGIETMPEIVRMCHDRLKQVIPEDRAELRLITLNNYREYVNIPEHIVKKFQSGIITMTTMSDVLRFELLYKYGGYWLDATVFFTGEIPEEYFTEKFYCQRMADPVKWKREACKGNWCGFSMAGNKGNFLFAYMRECFAKWWKDYDSIIDYVLIDYFLLSAYKHIPAATEIINSVPDNNEDIFELYTVLNQPYTEELYRKLTRRNVMHKLTYKMDLQKVTADNRITLYGYLLKMVYGELR